MTVKSDAAAITPSAHANAVAVAKGAQVGDLMNLIGVPAVEMQKLILHVIKLHPATTRPITVAGTAHAGDTLTLSITPSGGTLTTLTYVLTASDTLQSGALNLAGLVNANNYLASQTVTATAPVGGAFNLSYGLTPTVSGSVSGTGSTTTLTVGSAAGGADATNLTSLNALLAELA